MNKLLKKAISGAVSISTVLSALSGIAPVSAEDGISPQADITRHLTVEFLGSGTTPQTTSTQRDAYFKKSDVGTDTGNEFWVGVAVDNVNDLDLFTKGIYSLEIAFEYDSTYVVPYYKSASPSTQSSAAEWQEALESGNDSIWPSAYYDIVSVHNSEYDTFATDRENNTKNDRQSEPWRTCVVNVTSKETTLTETNATFHGLDTTDKQYILKLPFRLVDVPEDTSTEALSLVRAPETFNIGSGTDGTDPYASWQATVKDTSDQTNLKNLFTFDRDISLFGIGGAITDIIPFTTPKPDADPPETTVTTYTLYQSNELTDGGFVSDHEEYYVSVPNEVDELKLGFKASSAPTVTANSSNVTVSESDEDGFDYETDAFALNELDKEQNGGFSNTVTVTDGTTTYTIYIRRLLKPKIELNYGNSPVGMIMNDDETYPTDELKQAAVDDFKSTHKFSGVTKDLTYYTDAWTSYIGTGADGTDYNGDEDPYAMFVFQRESFKDVGFIAYDSTGEEVQDTDVSISLTMKSYKGGYVTYDDTTDRVEDISENATGNNHIFTNFLTDDIRPDIYDIIYEFTDPITDSSIQQTRKVIAISKRGDVRIDSNGVLNNGDASDIIVNVVNFQKPTANSLYKFRIADTRMDINKVINNGDATDITVNVTKGLPQFYNPLPK